MIDYAKRNDHGVEHFSRISLAVLLLAIGLLAAVTGVVIYRLLLPTEGWTYFAGTDVETNAVVFTSNLLGEPSPIQPGDVLRAIEGVSVDQASLFGPTISDGWRAGQIVRYTIDRAGKTIILDVPLKHWTAAGITTYALGDVNGAVGWLAMHLLFGIGLFVLLKRPAVAAGRALLLLATAILVNTISSKLVPDGPTTQYSAVWLLTTFFSYWIFGILLGPSLFVLSLTFPRPKRILQRLPWLVVLPYTAFWLLVASLGWLGQIGFGLTGLFFVLSLVSVVHSVLTQRDAVSRAQLRWGLGGFLSLLLLFLPFFINVFRVIISGGDRSAIPSWQNNLASVLVSFAFPVFAACLAIAILRYRLFDIDIIIRRALVYGTLTALLGLVYAGSVVGLQAILRVLTGQTQSQLVTVASTLAIAALFQPLRRRIQRTIDRRFFRHKYDAQTTLQAFSARLRDEVELDHLTGDLVQVVEDTLQPAHVSLWLRHDTAPRSGSHASKS